MLTDVTYLDLEYIVLRMRDEDWIEIIGIQDHDSPIRLAYEMHYFIRNHGRGRIAWHNGKPAACAFFAERWGGMWEVGMFGTKAFRDAAVPLLRWVRTEANEILSVCKGHRLQCDSRVGHDEAHKMIRAMGGEEEAVLRRYGKDGADYVRFVWLNGENDAVLKPGYVRAA